MFRVGMKVVCVDAGSDCDDKDRPRSAALWLAQGSIYTVCWLGEFPFEPDRCDGLALRLHEIDRGPSGSRPEWDNYPFRASRFRPVVERKTDISIFTKMLTPNKRERVDSL